MSKLSKKQIKTIISLHKTGCSKGEISKKTNIAWGTCRKYIELYEQENVEEDEVKEDEVKVKVEVEVEVEVEVKEDEDEDVDEVEEDREDEEELKEQIKMFFGTKLEEFIEQQTKIYQTDLRERLKRINM